jgi:hypothetical protein
VSDGWRLFCLDAWPLIIGALLVALIGNLTLELLGLPLAAGLYLMVLGRVRLGRRPRISGVFAVISPFSRWFWAWLLMIAIGFGIGSVLVLPLVLAVLLALRDGTGVLIAVSVGLAIVLVAVALYLGTIWMYAAILMGERNLSLPAALGRSYHMVRPGGLWRHIAVLAVTVVPALVVTVPLGLLARDWGGTIGLVVARLPLVGNLILLPLSAVFSAFGACVIAAAYAQDNEEGGLLPSASPDAPWPPADREQQYRALQTQWSAQWQAYCAAQAAQSPPPGD